MNIGRRIAECLLSALLERSDTPEDVDEFAGGLLVAVVQLLLQGIALGWGEK